MSIFNFITVIVTPIIIPISDTTTIITTVRFIIKTIVTFTMLIFTTAITVIVITITILAPSIIAMFNFPNLHLLFNISKAISMK